MSRNYYRKLSQEIIKGNYQRKLSASIYHHAKNVGIIGILAYPKNRENSKEKSLIFIAKKRRVIVIKNLWIKLPTLSIINGITLKGRFILKWLIR